VRFIFPLDFDPATMAHRVLLSDGNEVMAREDVQARPSGERSKERESHMARQENHECSERLSKLAKARAREKGIPFTLALIEIGRENPELAESARQETLGLNTRIETRGPYRINVIGPNETLRKLAQVRARETGASYGACLSEVAREDPDLARKARAEVLGEDQ
jgi:hypothetical protein